MERSVTIPLNEYENLKRRAEQSAAAFNDAVEKRVEEYRFNYKAKLQHLEEAHPYRQAVETYATWAWIRIHLLEKAIEEAVWIGGQARNTLARTPTKTGSESAGEERVRKYALRRFF